MVDRETGVAQGTVGFESGEVSVRGKGEWDDVQCSEFFFCGVVGDVTEEEGRS